MEKILEIINKIRSNKQLEPIATITESAHLRDDLGLDSFDLAELTVCVEEEFGVDVFEEGLVNTIGEIVQKIK